MLNDLQQRAHVLLRPAQFGDVTSRSVDNALHLLVFSNLIAVTLDSVSAINASYGYFFDIFAKGPYHGGEALLDVKCSRSDELILRDHSLTR